jgi:NAD(P)-dependent dehydrogenase (short-subunit alcohol dehydrogenase family)
MNIGDHIQATLVQNGWKVSSSHCHDKDGEYRIPMMAYDRADALVVSLGYTASVPWLEGPNGDVQEEDIDDVIRACLTLPLMAAKLYVQERHEYGDGKVVFIGSYAHDHVLSDSVAYCAAKAGLAQATRALAWDLTPAGFQFHIVHPYHVPDTPMGAAVVGNMMVQRGMTAGQAEEYQRKDLLLEDHLKPEEVASVVHWLLEAPVAKWLGGQGINLYGGTR